MDENIKALRRAAIRNFAAILGQHGLQWTDGELDEMQFELERIRDAKVAEDLR